MVDPDKLLQHSARISAAALRWAAARREADRLAAERRAISCEREDDGIGRHEIVPPCWKTVVQTDPDGGCDIMPEEQWCQPCRDRQVVYLALRAAARRRGACQRALLRYCDMAARP